MYVFGVSVVRIFPHLDWMQTKKTANMDSFYEVKSNKYLLPLKILDVSKSDVCDRNMAKINLILLN